MLGNIPKIFYTLSPLGPVEKNSS